MSIQKCPLCGERKAKRSCPAVGQLICTVCCATKRQVEIRCPADCVYLTSARSHPPAVVQRRQERDATFLISLVTDLTETQYRLLVLLQSLTVKHADAAVPALDDNDVANAAAAAAATLETAGKGIIYEHQAVSVPAQRLSSEYGRAIGDVIAKNSSHQSRLERDAAAALRKLEHGARTAATAMKGDEEPVFLRLLARVLQPGQGGGDDAAADAAPSSGLIVQP